MKTTPISTLAEFIDKLVFENPNETISTFKDEINVYTLKELNNRATLLAKGLLYNGVDKNTIVALVLAGTTNCLTFVLALAKIGAVLIPLNKSLDIKIIKRILIQENVHTIGFYADEYLKKFTSIVPDFAQNERGYLQINEVPALKNIVTFGSIKNKGIFTTRELMLLGEHVDDIEMESLIKKITSSVVFIKQITINKNAEIITSGKTHGEILMDNTSFPALQNFLINSI